MAGVSGVVAAAHTMPDVAEDHEETDDEPVKVVIDGWFVKKAPKHRKIRNTARKRWFVLQSVGECT